MTSRPPLISAQLPNHLEGEVSWEGNQPGPEADHSCPFSVEVKNFGTIPPPLHKFLWCSAQLSILWPTLLSLNKWQEAYEITLLSVSVSLLIFIKMRSLCCLYAPLIFYFSMRFSMRSVSCEGKVGGCFFPELFVYLYIYLFFLYDLFLVWCLL
jgi:hypothetical protein